jgi:hypothetical protein
MSEITTTRPSTAMNETEFQQYSPLYGPAVVTFALGLLSAFALIPWQLFLVLPTAAVITGLWALIKLRRLTGERTGRRWVFEVVFSTLAAVAFGMMATGDAISNFVVPSLRSVRAPATLIAATFLSGQFVILGLAAVAVVLAVFGLARLPKVATDAVSGERLVRLGMTVALVCGVGGTINYEVPRQMLIRSAADAGHEWLSALAKGELAKVIILSMHPMERPPLTSNLDLLLRDRDMQHMFNTLKDQPIVQTMGALGPETRIHVDGIEEVNYKGNGSEAQIAYRVIVPAEGGKSKASYFLVALQMIVDTNQRTGVKEWRIYDHQAPYTRGHYSLPQRTEGHGHEH